MPPPAARPRIRELRLRNFRSFADARLPLDDFTVLVGRNGAGKSNLLDAFDFLRDALRNGLRTAIERRGNFPAILHKKTANRIAETDSRIEIGVDLEIPALSLRVVYGFSLREHTDGFQVEREELQTYPKRSFSFTREGSTFAAASLQEGVKPVPDAKGLLLPLLAGQDPVWEVVHEFLRNVGTYDLSPHVMKLEPPIGNERVLDREGRNIGDVVQALSENESSDDMRWITSHLGAIVPDLRAVNADARGGRRAVVFSLSLGDDEEGHPQTGRVWNWQAYSSNLVT